MDKSKKPELPPGMRWVLVGEPVKAGDLKWDPLTKKWREVAQGVKITVRSRREGWYCRKIE